MAVLQAEAERFVLRPFLRGNENSMERHASRPATAGEAQPGPSTLAARSSMLQRLRTKSILECAPSAASSLTGHVTACVGRDSQQALQSKSLLTCPRCIVDTMHGSCAGMFRLHQGLPKLPCLCAGAWAA